MSARLNEIDGVESVRIDLDDPDGGISVRLSEDADERAVLDDVRGLLVTYGVRGRPRELRIGGSHIDEEVASVPGVEARITPIQGGARIEVATEKVSSFRVVPANPAAIAQGLSDAWCQVIGKVPVDVVRVRLRDDRLSIEVSDGETQSTGEAEVSSGWTRALTGAVGRAIGALEADAGGRRLALGG